MDYYILSPLLFFIRIFEVYSQLILVLTICDRKVKKREIIIGIFAFSLLYEILKANVPQYLASLCSIIACTMIIIFVFKLNYKKAFISCLTMGIIVAIVDCLVSLSLVKICGLNTFEELSKSEHLMVVGRIIIAIIVFIIALVIKSVYIRKPKSISVDIKASVSLITIIVTFLLLIPNLVMIIYYHDNKTLPLAIIIINIVAIIATFLINLYNTQRGIKLVQAEEELITEKTYNKTLQELVDSLRTFKHDYNNMLQTMHGYIFMKDMDGLSDYFEEVLKESKNITALDRLNPDLFKNSSLLGLVTAKFEYARKNGITMNFETYSNLDGLAIKSYDFTRILGIFLDNAIEATMGCEKKIVNFCVMEKDNKVTIDITNSFLDTGLTIENMEKKGVSSKGENRGLGLYKVKEILSKYPKIARKTDITNGVFLQRLIIEKNKED